MKESIDEDIFKRFRDNQPPKNERNSTPEQPPLPSSNNFNFAFEMTPNSHSSPNFSAVSSTPIIITPTEKNESDIFDFSPTYNIVSPRLPCHNNTPLPNNTSRPYFASSPNKFSPTNSNSLHPHAFSLHDNNHIMNSPPSPNTSPRTINSFSSLNNPFNTPNRTSPRPSSSATSSLHSSSNTNSPFSSPNKISPRNHSFSPPNNPFNTPNRTSPRPSSTTSSSHSSSNANSPFSSPRLTKKHANDG